MKASAAFFRSNYTTDDEEGKRSLHEERRERGG
jgi:hypothetical protein